MTQSIKNELLNVQANYLKLLKDSLNYFDSTNVRYCLDNILTFWYSNRRIVRLYLETIPKSEEFQTYIFTGQGYLNTGEKNHFYFTAIGKNHILDDYLCQLSKLALRSNNNVTQDFIVEQIKNTVLDYIEILEKYNDEIKILPVTYEYQENSKELHESTFRNFSSVFQEELLSVEEYLLKFNTIEDIYKGLKNEYKNYFIFSADDNPEDGLVKNFRQFIDTTPVFKAEKMTEAKLFFQFFTGQLITSINTFLCCARLGAIPFIRYMPSFYYMSYVTHNFTENPIVKDIYFRITCAYILYKSFPSDLTKISYKTFHKFVHSYDLDFILKPLYEKYKETSELSFKEIQTELSTFFDTLKFDAQKLEESISQ